MSRDVHRALEQLEEYHAELQRPNDLELKYNIEKVIGIFKTNLFHALCDIQDFYDTTLMNERISFLQKSAATRQFASRWESNPPFTGAYVRSHFPSASAGIRSYGPVSTAPPPMPSALSPVIQPRPYSPRQNRFIDERGVEWEVEEVTLDTRQVGLGFSITGGIDREPNPDHLIRVTEILKDGAVARDGRIKLNDVIVQINRTDCINVQHQTVVDAIHSSDGIVRIVVRRPRTSRTLSQSHLADTLYRPPDERILSSYAAPPPARSRSLHQLPQAPPPAPMPVYNPAPPLNTSYTPVVPLNQSYTPSAPLNQSYTSYGQPAPVPIPPRQDPNAILNLYDPRTVVLRKGDAGLGFNIVGGEDGEPIFISHVLPGGVADLSGNVRKGDILLRVNNATLQNATHQTAAMALRGAPQGYVELVLQYRPREFQEFEDKVERLRRDMLNGRVPPMR
uniref:PDZ domain-containing protein n=1 Tax=Panagrellus redivivus TaxID=6233 RepID=A0A7E4ZW59_PANRE